MNICDPLLKTKFILPETKLLYFKLHIYNTDIFHEKYYCIA